MKPNEPEPKYRVQSVDRALELLDLLADAGGEGAALSGIAKGLGVSKSTAFAILQTMLARGHIADSGDGNGRRYRLGMTLVRLGDQVLSQIAIRDVAMPVLRSLTKETGLTSRLAVLHNARAIVVARTDAPGAIRFNLHFGQPELLHCSSVGKALLSTLSEPEVRDIVAADGLPRRTPHTITDVEDLLRDLKAIRERGYSIDDEEDAEGICCIGARVYDHDDGCAGAISVTGLKMGLPAWRLQEVGGTVVAHADAITAELGGDARRGRSAAMG